MSVTGFGSLWRHKFDKNRDAAQRCARAVHYNTTGVEIDGTLRQRPKIHGYVRFHAGGGFDAHHLARMLGQVFECAEPSFWQGHNQLLVDRRLPAPGKPDAFLVVVRGEQTGRWKVGGPGWRSPDSWLISFSESGLRQEALLLLPEGGWIASEVGKFMLEPEPARPWRARLALSCASEE